MDVWRITISFIKNWSKREVLWPSQICSPWAVEVLRRVTPLGVTRRNTSTAQGEHILGEPGSPLPEPMLTKFNNTYYI